MRSESALFAITGRRWCLLSGVEHALEAPYICTASDWAQTGQPIWNQFGFVCTFAMRWRKVATQHPATFCINAKISIFRKMNSRRKIATVNCIFAHTNAWKLQNRSRMLHAIQCLTYQTWSNHCTATCAQAHGAQRHTFTLGHKHSARRSGLDTVRTSGDHNKIIIFYV